MALTGTILARILLLPILWVAVFAPQGAVEARHPGFRPIVLPQDAHMHAGAQTEWWYYTGHLRDEAGRTFGFELVTFKFQGLKKSDPFSPIDVGYRIDFAITDEAVGKFHSIVNYVFPVPGKTIVSTSNLLVRLAGGSGSVAIDTLPSADLRYRLRATMSAGSIDLTVDTSRRPLLEGGSGVVPMGAGGSSYYYSLTNMRTSGTLTLAGRRFAVTGATWMDHQWGSWRWDEIRGWDWMGVQLSNGTSVVLVNFAGARLSNKTAGSSFPDGTQLVTKSSFMTTLNHFWTSPVTSVRYPLGWHIQVPVVGLDAQVLPTIPDQEVVDPLSFGPTYWEGSCRVTGTLHGKPITGLAYTELVGYGKPSALGM